MKAPGRNLHSAEKPTPAPYNQPSRLSAKRLRHYGHFRKCEEYPLSLPAPPVRVNQLELWLYYKFYFVTYLPPIAVFRKVCFYTNIRDYFRLLPKLREHRNRYKTHVFFINCISHHYFSILQCYFSHFDAELNPH